MKTILAARRVWPTALPFRSRESSSNATPAAEATGRLWSAVMNSPRSHGLTDEQIAAKVLETRTAQGLPPKITDPATLHRVAQLLAEQPRNQDAAAKDGEVAGSPDRVEDEFHPKQPAPGVEHQPQQTAQS